MAGDAPKANGTSLEAIHLRQAWFVAKFVLSEGYADLSSRCLAPKNLMNGCPSKSACEPWQQLTVADRLLALSSFKLKRVTLSETVCGLLFISSQDITKADLVYSRWIRCQVLLEISK